MKRRKFLTHSTLAGAALPAALPAQTTDRAPTPTARLPLPAKVSAAAYANKRSGWSPFTVPDYYSYADDLQIERPVAGKPHQGKVLAAVQAHSDDIPLYAGGLVAKLVDEGYTAYLIRISNDEAA